MSLPLKTRQLQASKLEDFELYLAALEWGLIEPLVIEDRKDLRSEETWRERIEPYNHQISNLISFCRRLPVSLLADDVGLGKTISAGLVASELMSRSRVRKILIVCPKLIMPQWEEELKAKFNIASVQATGVDLLKAGPPKGRGAIITTYNSARLYIDKIVKNGFDLLILDEAHKLRNLHGTEKSPQVAQKFLKVLANRDFKYVLMLTATPIQNRLWDMYSLIKLLAVARGHENPFGSEGMFARRFIADSRMQARHLKTENVEEFRTIVYSHMSRVRRADAKLSFPERVVQQHAVKPTQAELDLINLISQPIQKLNRLAQISVAQALISSPHALSAQLQTMARNGTIPQSLSTAVQEVVKRIKTTAKQNGLEALVNQLRSEQSENWRMVVFTTRRETQTTIEAFLSEKGITCGTINGDSGSRNQETLTKFKKTPPDIHVILSTEAGAEGVNLQAANVIVNYDLPWNPMTVEQRIGRVQRLASKHAKVCVFNVTLRGTFEQYIVGRLMEKLQMASHAIGDIDALLGAAGIDDEDSGEAFEEKIRALVIDSLAGKDIEEELRLQEESIQRAKIQLETEEQNINDILGSGPRQEYQGPRCPTLEKQTRSLDAQTFTLKAIDLLGGKISPLPNDEFTIEFDGETEVASFGINNEHSGQPFGPGHRLFERMIDKISKAGRHAVTDLDTNLNSQLESLSQKWLDSFGGSYVQHKVDYSLPFFKGVAFVRARVTVAHDSYERLIEVACNPTPDQRYLQAGYEALPNFIFKPETLGIDKEFLADQTMKERNIAEFCRFYSERLSHEIGLAGNNERLRKKLEDDFTPRIQAELVGFKGQFYRQVDAVVSYQLSSSDIYQSSVSLVPATGEYHSFGKMGICAITGRTVPEESLGRCVISNDRAIRHLLVKSELSGRMATPANAVTCEISGKQLLVDEIMASEITGRKVDPKLLIRSEVSKKYAEPEYFGNCEFTNAKCLTSEFLRSEISGKMYRHDQRIHSSVSGKSGHSSEFIFCAVTRQPMALSEAETCAVSGKRVLPSELLTCAITRKRAIKQACVRSDISGSWILKDVALQSASSGKFGEPEHFGKCEFTNADVLKSELVRSQISGKKFRADSQLTSAISGKVGHQSEFIYCAVTHAPLAISEAETCEITGKKVAPTELAVCAVTGKRAVKTEFVVSDVSGALILRSASKQSVVSGKCAEAENFEKCDFTNSYALKDELAISHFSGKKFRVDQKMISDISGKTGHQSEFILCEETGRSVAIAESGVCAITQKRVASAELVTCVVTGKRCLKRVCVISDVTGGWIARSYSKQSAVSNKIAEPEYFAKCEFTASEALKSELMNSQFSGKTFRSDQQMASKLSGKIGHQSEIVYCSETNQPIGAIEAERCEVTGRIVIPGLLEQCDVTGKRVLANELVKSIVSRKKALRKFCVTSSVSGGWLIEDEAIHTSSGKFCAPVEASNCSWTGLKIHPDDLLVCKLTGLSFKKDLIEKETGRFVHLIGLLNGVRARADRQDVWAELSGLGNRAFTNAKCTVDGAEISPDGTHIAVCLKVSMWLGLRVKYAGFLFSLRENAAIGRLSIGKRGDGVWIADGGDGKKTSAA